MQDFLLSLTNFSRKEYMAPGSTCEVYLKRMRFFLNILKNPERKIPHYIHIAGTSGKGSTARYLASILKEAGYRTGLTTSPHAETIEERWEVNGTQMTRREYESIVQELKPALDTYLRTSPYDMISYFEITTAIAFLYFAKKQVEWAVIETGCGGRYDASNVIPDAQKEIAVITNIGLDHTEILGDTKEKIAYEKAGIITRGCRVFTAEKNEQVFQVIKKEAQKKKARVTQVTDHGSRIIKRGIGSTLFAYKKHRYRLPTVGDHQVLNAILGIESARALGIDQSAITRGIEATKHPYCVEIISFNPLIILDGAHNPDKMKTTVESLRLLRKNYQSQITDHQSPPPHIHFLIGFSDNKQWKKMIRKLLRLTPRTVVCTRFTNNIFRKAADPRAIARTVKRSHPRTKTHLFLDPQDAVRAIKKQMKKHDILLVTGSLFLAGEIRRELTK